MSDEKFTGPDFVVGSTKGIRVWRADALGRLTGWTHKQVWTPGENVAECRRGTDPYPRLPYSELGIPERPAPCAEVTRDCGCGFWAYHSGTPDFGSKDGVVGIVEGYGRTTIGTKGFRCSKARILALAFPRSTCGCDHGLPFTQDAEVERLVRRNYPEVAFFTALDAMLAEFPPDAPEHEGPSPEDEDFWTRPAVSDGGEFSAALRAAMYKSMASMTIPATSVAWSMGGPIASAEATLADLEKNLDELEKRSAKRRRWFR